jgi:hypothetical protein
MSAPEPHEEALRVAVQRELFLFATKLEALREAVELLVHLLGDEGYGEVAS